MTKKEIINSLTVQHKLFTNRILGLTESEFLFTKTDKWSAGQQLDHIVRAVSPLAQAFSIPKSSPNFVFGKSNRASSSYEELVEKYHAALKNGGKASGRFLPDSVEYLKRETHIEKLHEIVKLLNSNVDSYSEEELDEFTVPHPLLGVLTLREILYFTKYHVQHHHQLVLQYLAKK